MSERSARPWTPGLKVKTRENWDVGAAFLAYETITALRVHRENDAPFSFQDNKEASIIKAALLRECQLLPNALPNSSG
jgi:hypothetical protein